MNSVSPTKAERLYWDRLAGLGCIACLLDGVHNPHVSIHHIAGRTKKGCHRLVLPLCDRHHQTGGKEAPAIHPWRARFEAKYGPQMALKAVCDAYLERAA